MTTLNRLPILERRRIQAEVVKPIYAALKAEAGEETAKRVIGKAIIEAAIDEGKLFADEHGGPGGMHKPTGEQFRLAKDRTVYSYTQLGSGRSSEIPRRQWKIATFVKELDYLIHAWGLSDFHLMGGSWGTSLAIEYYLRYRGRGIKSLVLQSPLISSADWQKDADRLKKHALDKFGERILSFRTELEQIIVL